MATNLKSSTNYNNIKEIKDKHFGIVVSKWNNQITDSLLEGALQTLIKQGAERENIKIHYVPGSFELPLAAQFLAQKEAINAVICLGCIIQGETPHFDFISKAVSKGICTVGLKYNKPVIFGVLTTNNLKQASDRAGGKYGNIGEDGAIAALEMLSLENRINSAF